MSIDYGAAFNWVSMACAFLAAVFWYVSSVVRVKLLPEGQSHGHPEIDVFGDAFIATARRQLLWSRWGAAAAATAALFQGLSLAAVKLLSAAT